MHTHWTFVPIIVTMSSLLALDDIAQVSLPSVPEAVGPFLLDQADWTASVRALVSGTATLVVKNGAGDTLASKAIAATGLHLFRPVVQVIDQTDRLRFGFSGVGIGLADVTVTGWLKIMTLT